MWVRAVFAVCVAAGCYHPTPPAGLPCSDPGHTCPGDQVCDLAQVPPTCVDALADPDAGIDGDGPPPTCTEGCPASAPICDPGGQTCRGCIADSECPGACHELDGTCTTPAQTLYVSPSGMDGAACTKTAPCRSINAAVQQAAAGRRLIQVADGTYTDGFNIRNNAIVSGMDRTPAGATIMVTGAGGVQADASTSSVIEGVSIVGAGSDGIINRGTLVVSRVLVSEARGRGMDNRGGDLIVLDARVERCDGTGIQSNNNVRIERTVVFDNAGTGIIANGASTILNTIVGSNGTMTGGSPGGVKLSPSVGDMVVFRFNTLSENDVQAGGVTGIQCDGAVMLENSIFADVDGVFTTETGGSCSARYSMFDAMPLAGPGNFAGNPMFVNASNDFHLAAGSPAIDKADPAATETLDVDGDARPAGTARDIGADETTFAPAAPVLRGSAEPSLARP